MQYDTDKVLESLLKNVDARNMLNGGAAAPRMELELHEGKGLLHVKVPGVLPEQLQLRVKQNFIHIFYRLADSMRIVAALPIPPYIDLEGIRAFREGDFLRIEFPHRNDTPYQRDIDIE